MDSFAFQLKYRKYYKKFSIFSKNKSYKGKYMDEINCRKKLAFGR